MFCFHPSCRQTFEDKWFFFLFLSFTAPLTIVSFYQFWPLSIHLYSLLLTISLPHFSTFRLNFLLSSYFSFSRYCFPTPSVILFFLFYLIPFSFSSISRSAPLTSTFFYSFFIIFSLFLTFSRMFPCPSIFSHLPWFS